MVRPYVRVRRRVLTPRSTRAMTHAITRRMTSGATTARLLLSIMVVFSRAPSQLGGRNLLDEVGHRSVHHVRERLGVHAPPERRDRPPRQHHELARIDVG